MLTIGIYDLKTQLSSVLEEVLAGHVITVTPHGHAIASIQPVVQSTHAERLAAIARIREARRGHTLDLTVKELTEEGRRR